MQELMPDSAKTVAEIKKSIQCNFDNRLSAAVGWFCRGYTQALEQKKFDEKNGSFVFWFNRTSPKEEHCKKNPLLIGLEDILNNKILGRGSGRNSVYNNDFDSAKSHGTTITRWDFNFLVAFLSRMRSEIPNARVYYGDNSLVIVPEFVPMYKNQCSGDVFITEYKQNVEKLIAGLIEFILQEISRNVGCQGKMPIISLKDSPAKMGLTTLRVLEKEESALVYNTVIKTLETEYNWEVKIRSKKHASVLMNCLWHKDHSADGGYNIELTPA